jgi:hypothetical protein
MVDSVGIEIPLELPPEVTAEALEVLPAALEILPSKFEALPPEFELLLLFVCTAAAVPFELLELLVTVLFDVDDVDDPDPAEDSLGFLCMGQPERLGLLPPACMGQPLGGELEIALL